VVLSSVLTKLLLALGAVLIKLADNGLQLLVHSWTMVAERLGKTLRLGRIESDAEIGKRSPCRCLLLRAELLGLLTTYEARGA